MIDTCIFNRVADQKIKWGDLPKGEYVSTHIQIEEINNIVDKDKERKKDSTSLSFYCKY